MAPLPLFSQLPPVLCTRCFLGTLPGDGWGLMPLLPLNGVENDMLTAHPGLDYVSVSCQGSRTSGPPGLGARLERGALRGKAPEVPVERSCQEVNGRDSSAPSLDLAICQGCSGFK